MYPYHTQKNKNKNKKAKGQSLLGAGYFHHLNRLDGIIGVCMFELKLHTLNMYSYEWYLKAF